MGMAAFVKLGAPISTVTRSHLAAVLVQDEAPDAAAGLHAELRLVGEPAVVHELADASDAVAAHLGEAAVGVAVVHEEATRRLASARTSRITPSAPTPVRRSQSAATVVGLQRAFVVEVDDHDEVVAGALVLRESQLVGHASSRYVTHARPPRPSRPARPASNHRIRGSRRNQAICRRARFGSA